MAGFPFANCNRKSSLLEDRVAAQTMSHLGSEGQAGSWTGGKGPAVPVGPGLRASGTKTQRWSQTSLDHIGPLRPSPIISPGRLDIG